MRKRNRLKIQKEFLTGELSRVATLEIKVEKKPKDVQRRVITQSPREPGDHRVPPVLPGMGTDPPLGVTWEQGMYEYVWDYCSLWAEVTVSFPSDNFKFPPVSICSEWRMWILVSGQFSPWLSERFNAWWYSGTRHTQGFFLPCKISDLISHTYSHLSSLYRNVPLCSVPTAPNSGQTSFMPCPSQYRSFFRISGFQDFT